jgi:hypothetical protein
MALLFQSPSHRGSPSDTDDVLIIGTIAVIGFQSPSHRGSPSDDDEISSKRVRLSVSIPFSSGKSFGLLVAHCVGDVRHCFNPLLIGEVFRTLPAGTTLKIKQLYAVLPAPLKSSLIFLFPKMELLRGTHVILSKHGR